MASLKEPVWFRDALYGRGEEEGGELSSGYPQSISEGNQNLSWIMGIRAGKFVFFSWKI